MSQIKVYTCDVCGRQKQQSNHWFKVRIGGALHIYYWNFMREGADDDSIEIKHVCGQQCLLRLQQPFLDNYPDNS